MRDNPDPNLSDMCYTLQVGRKHFEYRKSLVFTDLNSILGLYVFKIKWTIT
ncbi:hypothetical protein ACFRAE_12670 [Sphingobacterium sp. HJSM2_6]|uniref:CurL C-terminal domain-containing protein n=1 Tax=Sphingobacterium sp. HJSM2_6 TaxID=3366264 RepID=UPI003BD79A41